MPRFTVGSEFNGVLGEAQVIPDRTGCNMYPCFPDAHISVYPHPFQRARYLFGPVSAGVQDSLPARASSDAKQTRVL